MEPNIVSTDETRTLISADKVEGTSVYNADAQNVGTIETIMLNKLNGRVAYAVLASGGFLGIGTDRYPIPWEALRYDVDLGGYRVSMRDFGDAPRFPAGSEPNWLDKVFDADVRRYYGVPDAATA
jgi:sporulation protein YlmC with PRC-barrel domain